MSDRKTSRFAPLLRALGALSLLAALAPTALAMAPAPAQERSRGSGEISSALHRLDALRGAASPEILSALSDMLASSRQAPSRAAFKAWRDGRLRLMRESAEAWNDLLSDARREQEELRDRLALALLSERSSSEPNGALSFGPAEPLAEIGSAPESALLEAALAESIEDAAEARATLRALQIAQAALASASR